MSSTVQILVKIIYSYYTRKRTTPFFLTEEEILSTNFYSFKERIINEVPHLAKANAPLQFSVLDGNLEVDLSPVYFEMQIKDLLVKHKELTIQAIAFQSPAGGILAGKEKNDNAVSRNLTANTPVRRSLQLETCINEQRRSDLDGSNENLFDHNMPEDNIPNFDEDEDDDEMPGDRGQLYVSPIDKLLQSKRQELQRQENKILTKVNDVQALEESFTAKAIDSTRPACSKCHLRLGHTRPLCPNEVCASARLCGELKKHPEEKKQIKDAKSELQALRNTRKKLQDELDSLQENIKSSKRTFSQLIHSDLINSNKKKYISIVNDREIINWMLLNSDAKKIEKVCGGKVPDAHTNFQDLIKEHDRLEFENTSKFKPTKTNKLVKQLWEKKGVVFPGSGPMYEPKECEQRFSEIPVPNSTEEEEYQINVALRESERSNTVCAWQNRPFDVPTSTCTAPWSRNSHLQSTSVHPFDVPSSTSTCTAPWSRNSNLQSMSVHSFDVPSSTSTCTDPWSRNSHLQSTSVHPFDMPSSTSTGTAPWSRNSNLQATSVHPFDMPSSTSTCTAPSKLLSTSVSNLNENCDGNHGVYADETSLDLLANAANIVESDQKQCK